MTPAENIEFIMKIMMKLTGINKLKKKKGSKKFIEKKKKKLNNLVTNYSSRNLLKSAKCGLLGWPCICIMRIMENR